MEDGVAACACCGGEAVVRAGIDYCLPCIAEAYLTTASKMVREGTFDGGLLGPLRDARAEDPEGFGHKVAEGYVEHGKAEWLPGRQGIAPDGGARRRASG